MEEEEGERDGKRKENEEGEREVALVDYRSNLLSRRDRCSG